MDYFIIVDKLINSDKNYENWNPLKYINQRYIFSVITSTPADNKLFADFIFIPPLYFYNGNPKENQSQWNFMYFFFILLPELMFYRFDTCQNIKEY